MSTFAPCDYCPGEVVVGKFEPIVVPRVDDDGFPILDPQTGHVKTMRLKLPQHRVAFVSMSGEPGPYSVFDPTGMVPVMCTHGAPEHPAGYPLRYGGQSFVRAKYSTVDFLCVVCHGAEPPADLTTPRDG